MQGCGKQVSPDIHVLMEQYIAIGAENLPWNPVVGTGLKAEKELVGLLAKLLGSRDHVGFREGEGPSYRGIQTTSKSSMIQFVLPRLFG